MAFTKPVYLRDAWVKFKKTTAGTLVQYSCQVKRFALVPEPGEEVTYATLGTNCSWTEIGTSTWSLEIDGVQGWGAADGLARFLFDNEGADLTFQVDQYGIAHTPTAEEPGFTGSCRAVPTVYGGEKDTYSEFEVVLPVSGKPTLVVASFSPTGLMADEEAATADEAAA
jgi:hypothetical protein